MHLNQIRFTLYHEKERKNKINANFVYIVYLLTKLCNIFDEAFFIDVSICLPSDIHFMILRQTVHSKM